VVASLCAPFSMVRAKLNTCSAMGRENRNSGVVVASIRKSPRKVRNNSFISLTVKR
jgi:hypothetical protein